MKQLRNETSSHERMWKIMRGMGAFTRIDIMEMAAVSEKTAKNYITLLKRAGCLRIDSKESTGRTKPYNKYRLARNTGPKAPVTTLILYDRNTGEYLLPVNSKELRAKCEEQQIQNSTLSAKSSTLLPGGKKNVV